MRKLQRNTNFEGAHDQLYRADSKNSPALSEFLSLITELQPETPTLPRYLQASSLLNRGPIIGTHIKKINDNLLTTQAFIDEYTKSGTVYHGTSLENVSSIIRGGFVISGIGQGRAALGSGLYTTKNRDFALSYGDIIFPLRIDQEKHLKIIDLKTITTALLKQLEDEASNKHFFDINELLKIAYHVDIIIKNNCAIIQNANVVEKILAHDLLEATGSAFQNKWMEYISLDNKLVPLIKYDDSSSYYKDNYHKIHDDFERYTLLHLLSGEFENDRVSPSTIIKQLTKTVKTIEETTENTQLDIKTKITKLFIYEHCDLAESSYVFQNLREIIKGTLTNNAAPTASAKKTEEALLKIICNFKQYLKEDTESHQKFITLLKTLILYANNKNLITAALAELNLIQNEKLSAELQQLLANKDITEAQALYFLAKIESDALQKSYLQLFGLSAFEERLERFISLRAKKIDSRTREDIKDISENINIQDSEGNTFLMQICHAGTNSDIEEMLASDEAVNLDCNLHNNTRETALTLAIKNKKITDECIIQMLKKYQNINLNYVYHDVPLIILACSHKRDILTSHLLSNAPPPSEQNASKLLEMACRDGLPETLSSLLLYRYRFNLYPNNNAMQ